MSAIQLIQKHLVCCYAPVECLVIHTVALNINPHFAFSAIQALEATIHNVLAHGCWHNCGWFSKQVHQFHQISLE
jgi:hypothetical protein